MKYLRVKNWEKLQHQSDRPLPWIKFFTALLAPTKEPCYSDWPDATKALLHHVWLMARVHNGRIPETWLTRERLNLKSRVNLDPLIDSGFVWFETEDGTRLSHSRTRDARSVLSESKSLDLPEGEREGEPNFAAEFESLWSDYPDQTGRKAALKHFLASVRTAEDCRAIRRALDNYKASDRVRRGFVQNGSTWFNNWRDWEHRAPQLTVVPSVDPVGATAPARVTVDDVREVEHELRTGQWHRAACTAAQAAAWVAYLRGVLDGNLTEAPTLEEFIRTQPTEAQA